jgi:hypothetical protein
MMTFMLSGGYAMWLILLFGGITLVSAILFAWRPQEARLGFVRGMTTATVFVTLSGLAAALGATFHRTASTEEWHSYPDIVLAPMMGIGESMSNGILGFSLLGVVWLVTAIGIRRLATTA